MKWFKHYENAASNKILDALLTHKRGHEFYGMYWLFLAGLAREFNKNTVDFTITGDRLCSILRVKYLKKAESFIEVLREIAERFERDFIKIESISSETHGKIYKFQTSILLELMGKEFKRTRQQSGKDASKNKEEDIEKEYIPDDAVNTASQSESVTKPKKRQRSAEEQNRAREIKQAYCTSYQSRYGIDPVFSAKENTLVYTLMAKIGYDEALRLAKLYPMFPDPWHLKKKHSFELLVNDLNKVRVELHDPRRMLDEKRARDDIQTALSEYDLEQERIMLEQQVYEEQKAIGYDLR